MKRTIFSFVSFGAIIIALIISFFATATVYPDGLNNVLGDEIWTIYSVVWGITHIKQEYLSDQTSTYFSNAQSFNMFTLFLIIALIIGILCIAFSKKDELRPLYYAFSVILIIAAIAFFSAKDTLVSTMQSLQPQVKLGGKAYVECEGHIACGVFLLLSGISTAVAGIVSNEDYF